MPRPSNYKTFAQLGRDLALEGLLKTLRKSGDFNEAYKEVCKNYNMSDSTLRGAISTKTILKEYNKRYSRQLNLIPTEA